MEDGECPASPSAPAPADVPAPDVSPVRSLAACPPNGPSPEAVAAAALALFEALPRTGKPQPHEHTVLAALVLSSPGDSPASPALRVLSLATGTKCLGADARDPGGAALNDCHAEVLARRAFLLALHAEARAVLAGSGSPGGLLRLAGAEEEAGGVAQHAGAVLSLSPGTGLHLFISQPPCGDACLLDPATRREDACVVDGEGVGLPRTGAKLLGLEGGACPTALGLAGQGHPAALVLPEPHTEPQAAGRLRRKPGRGDGTLSMSCSDKLARWCLLGLQGSLWSALLDRPAALESVTAWAAPGVDTAAASAALRRALVDRVAGPAAALAEATGRPAPPAPRVAVLPPGPEAQRLGLAPDATRQTPAGGCLMWHAVPPMATGAGAGAQPPPRLGGQLEGLTGMLGLRSGHKRKRGQGVAPRAASAACKARLGAAFAELHALVHGGEGATVALPYGEAKREHGQEYQARWETLRRHPFFSTWLPKPQDCFALGAAASAPAQHPHALL